MVLTGRSASFLWFLCLSSAAWTEQGPPRVIGSPQPVVSPPGGAVVLPCRLSPPLNVDDKRLTVEWSRPGPPDRPTRDYIHVYRNGREDTDMKPPAYRGRTALFADELRRGNVSLKISNVTAADGGAYRCYVPKLRGRTKEAVLQLVVGTPTPATSHDEIQTWDAVDEEAVTAGRSRLALVVPVPVLLLVLAGVFAHSRKH